MIQYKTLNLQRKGFLSSKIKLDELEDTLNELGRQDWDLVTSLETVDPSGTRDAVLIFKKPL